MAGSSPAMDKGGLSAGVKALARCWRGGRVQRVGCNEGWESIGEGFDYKIGRM